MVLTAIPQAVRQAHERIISELVVSPSERAPGELALPSLPDRYYHGPRIEVLIAFEAGLA